MESSGLTLKENANSSKGKEVTSQRILADFHTAIESSHTLEKRKLPDTGEEVTVLDVESFRSLCNDLYLRFNNNRVEGGGVQLMLDGMCKYLNDKKGITKDQYEQGDYLEKQFLYYPETPESATSTVSIKNAKFHFAAWDLSASIDSRHIYPTKQKVENDYLGVVEAKTAVTLFHPDYGDGFRDENGELFIRTKETREYVKCNYQLLLRDYGIEWKGPSKENRTLEEAIPHRLPHLVRKNIVRPLEDFRSMTSGNDTLDSRVATRNKVSSRGMIMLHGVKHYIGNEFRDRPVQIKEVAKGLGCVVEEGVITHLFRTYERDAVKPTEKGYFIAGDKLTQVNALNIESTVPKSETETLIDYQTRIKTIQEGLSHLYLDIMPELKDGSEFFNVHTFKEQATIAQGSLWLERTNNSESVRDFVKEYGSVGLRTLLSLEYEGHIGNEILAFAEKSEQAKEVFEYYGQLLDYSKEAEKLVTTRLKCTEEECSQYVVQVQKNILQQAQQTLLRAIRAEDQDSLLEQLQQYSADARVYVSLLRIGSPEKMMNNPLEELNATQLSDQDKNRMRELLVENYADEKNSEFKNAVVDSLDAHLEDPKTNFFLLKNERGQIVSFNRFDTMQTENNKKLLYFGSFNADSKYAGVGSVMMENTLQKKIQESNVVFAYCDPGTAISMKYIEDGFVGTTTKQIGGKLCIEIWRIKDIESYFDSKNMSIEQLLAKDVTGSKCIVREKNHDETFTELAEGYVLARSCKLGRKTILVFEEIPEDLQAIFQAPHH